MKRSTLILTGALLTLVLVRVFTTPTRVPHWDLNPLLTPAPETGLTPGWSLLISSISVLLSVALARACGPVRWVSGLLVLAGGVGVLLHGMVLTPIDATPGAFPGDLRNLDVGMAWFGAVAGAWGLSHAARHAEVRRLALGLLLGACVPLAFKGVNQVFVELPMSREVIAAGQGATPTSAAFERRLNSNDAFGWFGLANVYGTLLASGMLAFGLWWWGNRRTPWLLLAAIACVGGLWLSNSKGAALSLLVAAGAVLAVGRMPAKRGRLALLLCMALPLCAVLARGVLGERLGELSLLFRSQYWAGAAGACADFFPLGTGPAHFKDAYLLNRPALSPEEIESPHSVIADLLATLGVFGFAWLALIGGWLARFELKGASEEDDADTRAMRWACFGVTATVLGISLLLERATMGPTDVLARLVGFGGMLGVSILALRVPVRWLRLGALGAAMICLVHAQIEVTPVLINSTAWWWAVVAVGLAPSASSTPRPREPGVWVCSGLVLAALPALFVSQTVVAKWEMFLEMAASRGSASLVAMQEGEVQQAKAELLGVFERLEDAETVLLSGGSVTAKAVPPALRLAFSTADQDLLAAVERFSARRADYRSRSAAAWVQAAQVRSALGDLPGAQEAWLRASELDPGETLIALALWQIAVAMGDEAEADRWARRVLELDANRRLDPIRQLDAEPRRRVEAWLAR
ncbi:MAG: O-antigen ligase family protein [Planctomycetota bacterium]